jgi:hypothetical protein
MNFLEQPKRGEIGLIISSRPGKSTAYQPLLKAAAFLALQTPVRVLDCGNRFDVYQIARLVRRQTPLVSQTLDRISVARAFTCYQVVTLLEQTAVTPEPKIIINLLSTFYDENVSLTEAHRLLALVIGRLKEMRRLAPILISLQAPPQAQRTSLVTAVSNIADHILLQEPPPTYHPQPLL